MIAEEDVVITISHNGFVKRSPVSSYRRQGRGGRGITGAVTREDDFIEHMFVASTHQYMLIFTDNGRCYWLKVFEIPEAARMARGRSIINLVEKKPEEAITAFLTVQEFEDKHFVLMVSQSGLIKKTPLSEYGNPRRTGITAIGLKTGDKLIDVKLTDGKQDVIIGTRDGLAIRFHESHVRPMGRTALGVRGMALNKGDRVIGMVVLRHTGTTIFVATEKGYGKRTALDEYRPTGRAGKGVITVSTNEKIGKMVAIKETMGNDDIAVVTTKGMIIRQHVKDINVLGRNTQGVRLIRLEAGDTIADVAVVPAEEEEEALIEKGKEERDSDGKAVSKNAAAKDLGKDGERSSKPRNSGKKQK
jgi:DNA gyrase subunit A